MRYTPFLCYLCLILLIACRADRTSDSPIMEGVSLTSAHISDINDLPFEDRSDFMRVEKGFIGTLEDPIILNADGSVAIDLSEFDFLESDAPLSVNRSLWRQGQLNSKHGLFEVVDGIYQVRGFDLANMTLIRSDNGWIVIDPLTSEATANAALKLAFTHLGEKPIKAVIITHSHIDHFGGIKGVVSPEQVRDQGIEIIAPEGFYESAISENIIAGNGMLRRASYMYGQMLPSGKEGLVGSGLGQKVTIGQSGILRPTKTIKQTGERINVDGIEFIFQNTPGAEAPAEFMFYLPQFNAFCQAEEINHTMHNLYTLRGAHVRNGLKWSKYIDEAIQLFGREAEVSFGSHHWPTWGNDEILELWTKQRDLYKFIHDETLHLANKGYTMLEIAENIELPPSLGSFFANRGYYGTLSHNAKAQYQLYYGWFDANPAHLDQLPLTEASHHYVEYMGGADSILAKVKKDIANGELRWASMVLNHLVFAEPDNQHARDVLSEVYRQMAFKAESGPWRNFYLTGAQELKEGIKSEYVSRRPISADIITNLPLEKFYDYMAVRLDRSLSKGKEYTFNMIFPDIDERISLYLVNDVLHNRPGVLADDPNATIIMNKTTFNDIILGKSTGMKKALAGEIKIEGSRSEYSDFQKMIETPFELFFNIVEP